MCRSTLPGDSRVPLTGWNHRSPSQQLRGFSLIFFLSSLFCSSVFVFFFPCPAIKKRPARWRFFLEASQLPYDMQIPSGDRSVNLKDRSCFSSRTAWFIGIPSLGYNAPCWRGWFNPLPNPNYQGSFSLHEKKLDRRKSAFRTLTLPTGISLTLDFYHLFRYSSSVEAESLQELPSLKLTAKVPEKGWLEYYCWWLKSCTTWDVWNPINNGKNYLSTGAGFQPSTVGSFWGPGLFSGAFAVSFREF